MTRDAGDRDARRPGRLGAAANEPRHRLLHGAAELPSADRSLLLEAATRALYPAMLVVAVHLLLTGTKSPGGGFAAGLVIGLALVLRRLAGGDHELGVASVAPPGVLLGAGMVLMTGYAVAGLVLAGEPLASTVLHPDLPGAPPYTVPTVLAFEAGVALAVVGLVLDVLRTLGADRDRPGGEDPAGDAGFTSEGGRGWTPPT
jgi:multisubunit Na+/H+ antiporter MnhB subunit